MMITLKNETNGTDVIWYVIFEFIGFFFFWNFSYPATYAVTNKNKGQKRERENESDEWREKRDSIANDWIEFRTLPIPVNQYGFLDLGLLSGNEQLHSEVTHTEVEMGDTYRKSAQEIFSKSKWKLPISVWGVFRQICFADFVYSHHHCLLLCLGLYVCVCVLHFA